jgi:CheY-like chemotaxis protein
MKILCVEDSPRNRDIIHKMLRHLGYDIIDAADGNKALELVEEERPDLILMDYHIPGKDGITVTAELKSDPRFRHIPIVAISADIYSNDAFAEAGCDGFLRKPLRKSKLTRAIAEAFNNLIANRQTL